MDWLLLVSQIILLTTVVILALQLKQQRKQTNDAAYFEAMNLMMNKWDKMNLIMQDDFPGSNGWESKQREIADEVCMVFHQVGAAIKSNLLTEEICDVYFYAIPGVYEKCEQHILSRRESRASDYYHGFTHLVKVTKQRNSETKARGGRVEQL